MKISHYNIFTLFVIAQFSIAVQARHDDEWLRHGWAKDSAYAWMPAHFDSRSASYDLHKGSRADNAQWMERIPDATKLSRISIPGTRSSMAWDKDLTPALRCQNTDLFEQMSRGGIRFLDVPIYEKNGIIYAANSEWDGHAEYPVFQNTNMRYSVLLDYTSTFLLGNRRETIIIRFRPAPKMSSDKLESLRKLFWEEMRQVNNRGYITLFRWNTGDIPTMGEVRGKHVIITDFEELESSDYRNAMPLKSFIFRCEKEMEIKKLSDMERQWLSWSKYLDSVKKAIARFRGIQGNVVIPEQVTELLAPEETDKIFITYAAGGDSKISPEAIAAGGGRTFADNSRPEIRLPTTFGKIKGFFGLKTGAERPPVEPIDSPQQDWKPDGLGAGRNRVKEPRGRDIEGMNARILRKLKSPEQARRSSRTGIIVMDMPGIQLTEAIINSNFKP